VLKFFATPLNTFGINFTDLALTGPGLTPFFGRFDPPASIVFKLQPYTLAGFDLTAHSTILLGGRRRPG
jgi:hypothetical protein